MSPGEWIVSVQGTPTGQAAAMGLALVSAVAHAAFGAIQKGRHDPWLSRGAIDVWFPLVSLPVALFLVPPPGPELWLVLAGAIVIHTVYKVLMAMAYDRGAYTAVYPIVRGTGPLATVAFAGMVFGETFAPGQWAGVLVLSGAIFALAVLNIRRAGLDARTVTHASMLALITGVMVAVYSVYDAFGIRLSADPFTFLAWFFVVEGLVFPLIAFRRWQAMELRPNLGPLLLRGFVGSWIAYLSFGAVMLATRLDKVGEAVALRETSVVFAALIGWLFLKEPVGPLRAGLMVMVAAGAVLVEFG